MEVALRLVGQGELRLERLAAVARPVAESIGSRQRNSDTHRMRHTDLDHRSTGRIARCSLWDCRLLVPLGSLAELELLLRRGLRTVDHHNRRCIHHSGLHSLDDRLLAGSHRNHSLSAEGGSP